MNWRDGGAFEFRNVPEGDYIVGLAQGKDMHPGDPNTRTIKVTAGETIDVSIVEQ